jgi:hypothetical protein
MAGAAQSMASSRAQEAESYRRGSGGRGRREHAAQPHTFNPNQAAIEIETHAKN